MNSCQGITAELPDLLPGVDAVASEAGSDSGQSGQYAPRVEAEGNRPPASLQAPKERAEGFEVPEVFKSPQVVKSCRKIQKAAREAHYPLVFTASQMKHMERALSLAIDDAIEAMSDEPDGRHEIQPYLDAYNEIFAALNLARASNKGKANEDWRGVDL